MPGKRACGWEGMEGVKRKMRMLPEVELAVVGTSRWDSVMSIVAVLER